MLNVLSESQRWSLSTTVTISTVFMLIMQESKESNISQGHKYNADALQEQNLFVTHKLRQLHKRCLCTLLKTICITPSNCVNISSFWQQEWLFIYIRVDFAYPASEHTYINTHLCIWLTASSSVLNVRTTPTRSTRI